MSEMSDVIKGPIKLKITFAGGEVQRYISKADMQMGCHVIKQGQKEREPKPPNVLTLIL